MELGHEPGLRLSLPTDVAVGADGTIYVVDSGNHQVAVFDASGRRVTSLGSPGSGDRQLMNPVGLAIDSGGDIYVADKDNKRLQVFAGDGGYRRSIDLEEGDERVTPIDVALSADGNELFVSANNSHRIVAYSRNGTLLRAWGGEGAEPGQLNFPATMALDESGRLYVVDVLNQRVQVFDSSGTVVTQFGKLGAKPGTLFRPKGVTLDPAGRSYVSDSYLGVIQVFDASGEFLHVLGESGTPTIFQTPVGLSFHDSRLYVVQMLPGNVLVLELGPELEQEQ